MSKKHLLCISLLFFVKHATAGDQSSLTFVIDDTSSMSDDIRDVRSSVNQIFDMVTDYKDTTQVVNYILVVYNDRSDEQYEPDVRVLAKTNRRDIFLSELDRIDATTGGAFTCAEYPLAGIRKGLEESLPRSTIYVFTDATAKDYDQFEEVKRIALQKQCSIVFVLTGMCNEGPTAPKYKVFQDLAAATNGQVFHMNKGEMGQVLNYVKATVTGPRTNLASKDFGPGTNNFNFDADPKMDNVLLSVTSIKPNDPTVKVKAPDGSDTPTTLIAGTNAAKVYAVNVTQPGQHTVEVNSPVEPTHTVVSANTKVSFNHGFSTFIPTSLVETSIRPVPGNNHLSIKLTDGNIDLKSVRILDMNQNLIQELPLSMTNKDEKLYTTQQFETPGNTFLLAIVGFDPASNSNIVRQAPTPVEVQKTLPGDKIVNKPVTVVIEGGEKVSAKDGQRLRLICKVEGYPRPTIVWKNERGDVLSDTVLPGKNVPYDYVNVLTISRVTVSTKYTCEARNVENVASKVVAVDVAQPSYLRITDTTRSFIANCDETFELDCTVESQPESKVQWYKNGRPLLSLPGGHYAFGAGRSSPDRITHSLIITKPTPADNGRYTCEASNGIQKQNLDHLFAVLECNDRVSIDKTLKSIDAIKGQSVTIECKVLHGNPKPKITWSFITTDGFAFNLYEWQDKETNVLNDVGAIDGGKYACRADNGKSRDIHFVTLSVN